MNTALQRWPEEALSSSEFAQQLRAALRATLWHFEGAGWVGYLDLLADGRYFTHWGFGTWEVDDLGRLRMRNDYDHYGFVVHVNGDGSMNGKRSDGLPCSGRFISTYGKRG